MRRLLLIPLLLIGCASSGPAPAPQPNTPSVKVLSLADITEALADAIPASIDNSDQLILVLDDMVTVKKLTDVQSRQIRSAVDLDSLRPLTDKDSQIVRGVK